MKNKIKVLFLSTLIFLIISVSGCDSWKRGPKKMPVLTVEKDIQKATKDIKKSSNTLVDIANDILKNAEAEAEKSEHIASVAKNIQQKTEEIKTRAATINEKAEEIDQKTDGSVKKEINVIKKEANNITIAANKVQKQAEDVNALSTKLIENSEKQIKIAQEAIIPVTKNLIQTSDDLKKINPILKDYIKRGEDLGRKNEELIRKNEELQRESEEKLHALIRYLIVGCIVGVGVFGVVFLMYGSRFGIVGAASCALILSVAIFVESYFPLLAVLGGVLLLGLIGVLIWNIIVQKRAFKEIVDTVEITQDHLPATTRQKLFGGPGQTGIMDGIQSKKTMNLVKKQKNKMSNLWSYAKTNKK